MRASLDVPIQYVSWWSSSPLLRVERIAQPVPHEVEREHGDHDGEARIDHEVRRRQVVRLALADHLSPGRRRRLYAEADVAERRLEEDRRGEAEAGVHEDDGHQMRQDVAGEDAPVAAAGEPRRVDELLLADAEHLAVDHARHRRPVDDADDEDQDPDARFEDAHQRHGQEDDGERHHHVGRAHQEGLDPPSEVAGGEAEDHAEDEREAVGEHADHEAHAGAVHEPAEQVAAERVGAQPELAGGADGHALHGEALVVLLGRVVRGDPGRQQGDEDEADDDDDADHRELVAPEAAPDLAPERAVLDEQRVGAPHAGGTDGRADLRGAGRARAESEVDLGLGLQAVDVLAARCPASAGADRSSCRSPPSVSAPRRGRPRRRGCAGSRCR